MGHCNTTLSTFFPLLSIAHLLLLPPTTCSLFADKCGNLVFPVYHRNQYVPITLATAIRTPDYRHWPWAGSSLCFFPLQITLIHDVEVKWVFFLHNWSAVRCSRTILVQGMLWCLTAPSLYLSQCCALIKGLSSQNVTISMVSIKHKSKYKMTWHDTFHPLWNFILIFSWWWILYKKSSSQLFINWTIGKKVSELWIKQ